MKQKYKFLLMQEKIYLAILDGEHEKHQSII